jgi:hypothetical protein
MIPKSLLECPRRPIDPHADKWNLGCRHADLESQNHLAALSAVEPQDRATTWHRLERTPHDSDRVKGEHCKVYVDHIRGFHQPFCWFARPRLVPTMHRGMFRYLWHIDRLRMFRATCLR